MPKCALKNCKNITSRTLKKDGISYFHFPRNPIRCGEWTAIVSQQRGEDFYKPNNSSVVCSQHFLDDDMYVTDKGMKRLHKTAIPHVAIKDPDSGGKTEVIRARPIFDLEIRKELNSHTSPISIDSTLDTLQVILLKSELNKCRNKLIDREKVITNLRKKNGRLLKKTILLKNALKNLRERLKLKPNINI